MPTKWIISYQFLLKFEKITPINLSIVFAAVKPPYCALQDPLHQMLISLTINHIAFHRSWETQDAALAVVRCMLSTLPEMINFVLRTWVHFRFLNPCTYVT